MERHSTIRKLAVAVAGASVALTAACSAATPKASAPHGEGIGAGGVAGDTNAPPKPCTPADTTSVVYPGALPEPGHMPDSGTLGVVKNRGFLIAGIDLNTKLFGEDPGHTNDPAQYRGFDIDIARQIAKAIFGDPAKIQFKVVTLSDAAGVKPGEGSGEVSQLNAGNVDVVVRTTTITCRRLENANFSNPYFIAEQRLLVSKGSGVKSIDDFKGKDVKVCATNKSTALDAIVAHLGKAAAYGATNSLDCLALLQEGKVDAVSTDDSLLAGMVAQDPKVEIVGDSLGHQPYGVVTGKNDKLFAGFVNSVLTRIESDGTWKRILQDNLGRQDNPPAVPPSYAVG